MSWWALLLETSGHSLGIADNMVTGTVFIIQEGRTTMPVLHPPPPSPFPHIVSPFLSLSQDPHNLCVSQIFHFTMNSPFR